MSAETPSTGERVAAMRQRFVHAEVTAQDLTELVAHGASMERLLDDIWEVGRQLFAAGVAYPDPDMPEELGRLIERAERYGLATAVELLAEMHQALGALTRQTDLFARADGSEVLWQVTLKLVTWLRLFRQEQGLVLVQGRLSQQSSETPTRSQKPPRLPVRSMTCWPLGVLRRGQKLTVLALPIDIDEAGDGAALDGGGGALKTRRPTLVHLIDELPDVPALGPFDGLVISRLFRDQLNLSVTLSGMIRLHEHPVVETRVGGEPRWLFRPAFTATAQQIPAARSFVAPALTPLEPAVFVDRADGRLGPEVGTAALQVRHDGQRATLHWGDGTRLAVPMTEALGFNLLKLLAREGAQGRPVNGTLHRLDAMGSLALIALETEFDGRTFPVDDVRAFRWERSVVMGWALDDAPLVEPSAGPEQRWAALQLQAAAAAWGGASAEAMAALKDAMDAYRTQDWARLQRFNALRAAFGDEPMPLKGAPRRAMAVVRAAHTIKRPTSKGYVESEALFGALAGLFDYGGGHLEEVKVIEALVSGRFETMSDWGWTDVCCRALLLSLAAAPEVAGQPVDEQQADDTNADAHAERGGAAGLAFLDAHVDGLRRGKVQEALPDADEWLRIAYTVRTLTGTQAHEPALAMLDVPWTIFASQVAGAIARWRLTSEPEATPEHLRRLLDSGTALLLGLESGLGDIWMAG